MKAAFSALALLVASAVAVPTSFTTTVDDATAVTVLFPNYLVPAKENTPNQAYNTQFTARVNFTSATSGDEAITLVGFDVPANGLTNCAIKFELAPKDPNGFQWEVTGTGRLSVYQLASNIVPGTTTWANRPAKVSDHASFFILQSPSGGAATMGGASIPCKQGQRMDFEVSVTRPGPAGFLWFELSSPKTGITLEMS